MSKNIYFLGTFESTSLFSDGWHDPEYVYRRFAIGGTTLKTVFSETESEPALSRLFRVLQESSKPIITIGLTYITLGHKQPHSNLKEVKSNLSFVIYLHAFDHEVEYGYMFIL